MAEIKVSTAALQEAISQLNTLKSECESFDTNYPAIIGGGQTVGELEAIANLYKQLNVDLTVLIGNTALFMTNVKNSFEHSDAAAATGITGK